MEVSWRCPWCHGGSPQNHPSHLIFFIFFSIETHGLVQLDRAVAVELDAKGRGGNLD